MCKKEVFISIMIGALLLSGCSTKANQAQNADNSAAVSSSITEIDTSDMFSNRDKEVGYDESESVTVSLADDGSSCESDAVSITENTVTIKDEGTYVLSGALSDGMVIVDAEDTDKIQLVLKDVSISNAQSAALYVRAADKVFVTTASGTENTLENCGGYTAIDDNNIDAAVFSKSDLTFNGEGTLTITAQEGHGIVSKDDLALTSGTYVAPVQAMEFQEKTVFALPMVLIRLHREKMESMQKIRTTAARVLCIWQAERLIFHPSRMESAPVRGYRQTMVLIRFWPERAVPVYKTAEKRCRWNRLRRKKQIRPVSKE